MRLSRRAWLRGTALAVIVPLGGGVVPLLAAAPRAVRPGAPGVATVWDMSFWSADAGACGTPVRAAPRRRIEVPQWHADFA